MSRRALWEVTDVDVTDVDVTDLVFIKPRIAFCAADALWGGVMHTFQERKWHININKFFL